MDGTFGRGYDRYPRVDWALVRLDPSRASRFKELKEQCQPYHVWHQLLLMYTALVSMVEYNAVRENCANERVLRISASDANFVQTVTGANIRAELPSHWHSQVVLVEEAAEVLGPS